MKVGGRHLHPDGTRLLAQEGAVDPVDDAVRGADVGLDDGGLSA